MAPSEFENSLTSMLASAGIAKVRVQYPDPRRALVCIENVIHGQPPAPTVHRPPPFRQYKFPDADYYGPTEMELDTPLSLALMPSDINVKRTKADNPELRNALAVVRSGRNSLHSLLGAGRGEGVPVEGIRYSIATGAHGGTQGLIHGQAPGPSIAKAPLHMRFSDNQGRKRQIGASCGETEEERPLKRQKRLVEAAQIAVSAYYGSTESQQKALAPLMPSDMEVMDIEMEDVEGTDVEKTRNEFQTCTINVRGVPQF